MTDQVFPWLELQRHQHAHDADYHPEIVSLPTADKLKHMTLHNAKYAARFLESELSGDDELFRRTLVDAFVISLATANALTQRLAKHAVGISTNGGKENSVAFTRRYLEQTGRMAKACESIDHLEPFPFRETIASANARIAGLIRETAVQRSFDIVDDYRARIAQVEEKSGFAMFHPAEDRH